MATQPVSRIGGRYLDMQAYVGITKHNGGLDATNELLSLCHIETAREVLNVGCGIGATSAYIARKYACRVAGVDISEKMIAWSRKRAREARVEERVEFRTADVLDLPFDSGRFDVVFAESVLAFVEDKPRAIRECVRVARPGGYIGLNETFWFEALTPEMAGRVKDAVGTSIPTIDTWQGLWDASGLEGRVLKTYRIDARREVRGRIKVLGLRWVLGGFYRLLRLYLRDPGSRPFLKDAFNAPLETLESMGYGLFVGQKPGGGS